MYVLHLAGGITSLTSKCNHVWEKIYSNLKETKYECSECGATQIIPRVLEKHTHDPMDDQQ